MKYYLLILEDENKKHCCGSNLPELSASILNSITNGYVKLFTNIYIFKSNQNIKYWNDLIISKIDKVRNQFYICETSINDNNGWLPKSKWEWMKLDKEETNKSLCMNTFEITSCEVLKEP